MVILGSGIGLYYYLRVMVVMYMTPPDTPRLDAVNHRGKKWVVLWCCLAAACSTCDWCLPRSSDCMSKLAFFAMSPELQQFISLWCQSGFN